MVVFELIVALAALNGFGPLLALALHSLQTGAEEEWVREWRRTSRARS